MSSRRCLRWGWPGLLLLVGAGCGVDLLVGGGGTTTGAEGSETGEPPEDTTDSLPPPPPDEGDGTTETGEPIPPETTTGEGATTEPMEGSTSTGSEPESTTGDPACEGQTFPGCNELPYCLWYGDPRTGECALSPCEQPMHDCLELIFELCVDLPMCAWVGEPEMGECGPIECVPCEILGQEQCNATPTCEWNEAKMFCGEVPV